MNPKMQSLCNDIEKTKGKITELQARLRDLERRKTELENSEIVGIMRGIDVAPEELADFIKAFKEQRQPPASPVSSTIPASEKEEEINEE